MKYKAFSCMFIALVLCACHHQADVSQSSDAQTEETQRTVTEDMALEGISNYCHQEFDWSAAKDNPDLMYVTMGEETDSAYQVVFRSYTGSFVHFYVNKTSGATRMVEVVPSLHIEEDAGTINLFDYIKESRR